MPLHLLPKKSWNVYNADNIARVKRDEAAAAARVEADEQSMQEDDAARRLAILRGESPPPLPPARSPSPGQGAATGQREHDGRSMKRRKLRGEDDTEMEMRYAATDYDRARAGKELKPLIPKDGEVRMVDGGGHINLFTEEEKAVLKAAGKRSGKNAEVEKEKKRKEKELEDQYTMRFSNAAGFKQEVGGRPWYFDGRREEGGAEVGGKDVWGNEDPRRKERERGRVEKDDPLAMIRRGVAGVREVERERDRWRKEREVEVGGLVGDDERRREKRRRKRELEEDEFGGFSLDGKGGREHRRKSHHERRRSRSRERHGHRHRHRHEPMDESIRA